MDIDEARYVASGWHGGQWSPLYALASSGTVTDGALAEARDCLRLLHAGQYDAADIYECEPPLLALIGWLETQS